MSEIPSIPRSFQVPTQTNDSNQESPAKINAESANHPSDTIEKSSADESFGAILLEGSNIQETTDSADVGIQRLNDLRSSFDTEMQHARDGLRQFEEKLNAVGDDAQLANVDLQNILQKQQQTLQMMSNISKMLFDTASAVIRKIGG
jgi:hypothetical protein